MKAVYQEGYGSTDDLYVREVDKPAPGDDEVLYKCAPRRFIPTFGT